MEGRWNGTIQLVVAQINLLKAGEIEVGNWSCQGIVLEVQGSEKCQILYGIWNAASEGIEGEVKNIELWGER